MANIGVGDTEVDVLFLSDNELSQKLRQLGANIGPITSSTRAVYQRKLQRWLQYGPPQSADSSTDFSIEEQPIEIVMPLKTPHALDQPTVRRSQSNDVNLGSAKSIPAAFVKLRDVSTGSAVSIDERKTHGSPARMSKSDGTHDGQTYSLSEAECGSGPVDNGADRCRDTKPLTKQNSDLTGRVSRHANGTSRTETLPSVSAEDIELVNRALMSDVSSAESSTSPEPSPVSSHIKSPSDDENILRNRYTSPYVTARPPLRRDFSNDCSFTSPLNFTSQYRSMLATLDNSHLSTSSQSISSTPRPLTTVPPRPRRRCDTRLILTMLLSSVVFVLFVWAVVRNMEPGYVNPLTQE